MWKFAKLIFRILWWVVKAGAFLAFLPLVILFGSSKNDSKPKYLYTCKYCGFQSTSPNFVAGSCAARYNKKTGKWGRHVLR